MQSELSYDKASDPRGLVYTMDYIPEDKLLEVRPDTLHYVRQLYNMEKPGYMKDAITILHEWVKKQPHFNKKDFSDHYLEGAIISNKGSIERAKTQIDKMCTLRTLLPQFFGCYNAKCDFDDLFNVSYSLVLPKVTDDHYRVFVCKFNDGEWEPSQSIHFYRHNIILAEYIKVHDYLSGFVTIIDFSEANLMEYLAKINLVELRQALSIYIDGCGMRIKAIHIISKSKVIDTFVSLLKQVLSAKVAGRIKVHKNCEALHEFISKDILPKDYGGEERSLKTLQDEWIEVLSSEAHLDYLRDITTATTDESSRQKDKFTEQYAGMPGTFRVLSVD